MTTIETIEIDGILREVEVDWDLYKGKDNKRAKNAFVDLLYRLNKKGYKILSEYTNNSTKVLIDFNCGHEPHWITPNMLKQGRGCPKCSGNCSIQAKENFYRLCEEKGYKILSEYINESTKVLIDFNCGHEPNWITPDNLKKGRGCPKCAIEKINLSKIHKAKEDFYKFCKEKGYKILSDYVNNKTKVLIDFNCGHEPHWITPNAVKRNVGCPKCSGNCSIQAKENFYRLCEEKGYKILSEYINESTKVLIDFNCGHEPNWITPDNLKKGRGCPKCAIENRSGKNSVFWKGGITPLANYLREKINQWKKDSFKQTNYRCVITGVKGFNVVHHLIGFNTILVETMETLNLPIYQKINEYTEEELKLIEDKCLELHYKYGLGVVLSEEVHKEFHSIYGYGDNTPEQFEEFRQMKLNHKEECA